MVSWFTDSALGPASSVWLLALLTAALGASLQADSGQGGPAQAAPAPPSPSGQEKPDPRGPVRGPDGAIIGFTHLAEIPGTPWRIHDAARPHPRVVTPGPTASAPPSDAVVLFDGKDLSKFAHSKGGQLMDAQWVVRDGYFEVVPKTGSIVTREKWGDVQLHLEFAMPDPPKGASQDRGNSGVIFMGYYEVQVLDSFENLTYADGQAASIYGEYPPLVNAARRPGEWQTYDIIFEAPRFRDTTLVTPAYATVIWNGVLVHHRRALMGRTSPTTTIHGYTPHDAELPFTLQDHSHPVRFRNVWVRRLNGYDQP
jgi:hypothetical protein